MTFRHERMFFDNADYVIFSGTLIIPILIGIYYACFSKKKPKTVSEYLVGSRNMELFPVSMSLAASSISGYSVIGPISEVYFYGIQFLLESIALVISLYCFAKLYLAVFYNLKITSTYEYLQMRFDYKVRLLGSVLFLIKTLVNMALWVYAPVLMLEQVIEIDIYIIIPIFSAICIFYTTFGGVRAVIWADTFQMILMLLGMIMIIVVGVSDVGGFAKIWEINNQGQRLQIFDFDPDPRLRQSFWIFMVGYTVHSLSFFSSSQFMVQRCASLPTLTKAKIAIIITSIISVAVLIVGCYVGLILYAAFHDCDPISAHKISKPDQLLPYFIMNLKNRVPALPSVVISIVFCAALSSVSSGLNSMAGVILIDFIHPFAKKQIKDVQGSQYMKIMVLIIGVLYTGLTYTLNNANSLVQSTMSLISISLGTSLGIFTLGVLFPWANANGAFFGGIAGGLIVAWMSIGAQIAVSTKQIVHPRLSLSIENCENLTSILFSNNTLELSSKVDSEEPIFLYRISFYYYAMIGAFTAIIVGLIVSCITGLNEPKSMDPRLFSPLIRRYLKRNGDPSETTKMTIKFRPVSPLKT